MEKAIFYKKNILNIPEINNYQRVYLGNDLCDQKLSDIKIIKKILNEIILNKKKPTLTTPFFGLNKENLIENIIKNIIGIDNMEIVINDWGILEILKGLKHNLNIICGRLLTSQYFYKTNIPNKNNYPIPKRFFSFLNQWGIKKIEINSYEQINYLKKSKEIKDIELHIYFPYTYIAISRFCLAKYKYRRWATNINTPCNKECDNYIAYMKNPYFNSPIYIKGNAYLIKEKTIPDYIKNQITRIIYNNI